MEIGQAVLAMIAACIGFALIPQARRHVAAPPWPRWNYHGVADGGGHAELEARMRIRLAALRAGRRTLPDQHQAGVLSGTMLASKEREMDLEELRILRLLGAR